MHRNVCAFSVLLSWIAKAPKRPRGVSPSDGLLGILESIGVIYHTADSAVTIAGAEGVAEFGTMETDTAFDRALIGFFIIPRRLLSQTFVFLV